MNSLLDLYKKSACELDVLLQRYEGPQTPVIEALALLAAMIAGNQTANGALFIARNTSIQEEDADLGIMLLAYWARALVLQVRKLPEKIIEAEAVIHRARALIGTRTAREIQVLVELTEALLLEAQGNMTESDNLMKKTLKKLPAKSPRQPWLLSHYAVMLARSGRLSELERRLSTMETSATYSDIAGAVLLARFINQVETCNLHQAEQLLSPLGRADFSRPYNQFFDSYRILLPMLRATLSLMPQDATAADAADEVTPDWSLVIRTLASGNSAQALKWARISEKREPTCLTGNNMVSLNLLRAELAERNLDAARRLLSLRRSRGNTHYLDSLFECRAMLLEGSIEPATELYCDAVRAAEQHNARHRLELEMALAVELPHHIILKLAERSSANSQKVKRTPARLSSVNAPIPRDAVSGVTGIIGASQATEELRRTVLHFAKMDVPVMITGETGTGKDLIAHAIHEESDRRDLPFIAVNCASISESLLESELFGHEKGAFTGASSSRRGLFEEADGGFIFLDEIGEISARLQAALLRVLETGEVRPVGSSTARKTNCRILTATNADLNRMAQDGSFRQDILFRLKRLEINIPPLRDRGDDILPLASFFLNQNRTGDSNAVMSEDLCRLILSYNWPGNVRELRNVIERMRLMNSDKLYYEVSDIGLPIAGQITPSTQLVPAGQHSFTEGSKQQNTIPVARRAPSQAMRKGRSRMRRLEMLKEMFRQHKTLTRSEIIDATSVSPNIATADLKQLVSEGFADRIQPSKSPRSTYFRIKE